MNPNLAAPVPQTAELANKMGVPDWFGGVFIAAFVVFAIILVVLFLRRRGR